jgi:hypothetical protein
LRLPCSGGLAVSQDAVYGILSNLESSLSFLRKSASEVNVDAIAELQHAADELRASLTPSKP